MNNLFIGPFKDDIFEYYQYKINLGYNFKSELNKLKVFDKYTCKSNNKEFNLQLIYDFLDKRTNISANSKASYATVLRGFIKYLYNNQRCNFLLPVKLYGKEKIKIPHIFTYDEVNKIFNTLENFYPNDKFKNDCIYLIIKLLLCTGMRISECLNIKLDDIDINSKSITLYNTKNKVDRKVVLKDDLFSILYNYINKYNYILHQNEDKYIFIRHNLKKYNRNDIGSIFKKILYYSKIDKKGIRLHDFRHTFCVYSYKKILKSGKDYYNHIIALSTYVGHKDFLSTEYYLRLTSELYPEIRNIINNYTGNVIKDIGDLNE